MTKRIIFLLTTFAAASAVQATTWIVNPANGHLYGATDGYYRGIDKGGRIGLQPTVWDAEALAVSLGGHLVTINGPEEQEWLLTSFGTVATDDSDNLVENFWIGLNDLEIEGDFRWFSGDPVTYVNWAFTEPSNDQGEDVVALDHPSVGPLGQWNDVGFEMLGERRTTWRAILEVAVIIANLSYTNGAVRLSWNAAIGLTYCVLAVDNLNTPWSAAQTLGCIVATDSTGRFDDIPPATQSLRFYRVVQQP
jgi:hypothetical protein